MLQNKVEMGDLLLVVVSWCYRCFTFQWLKLITLRSETWDMKG